MKGDFSRLTFDPRKRYSRVLMQQGRVQLDADWNEQAALQSYLLRTLAADLIGPHGGPASNAGFEIRLIRSGNKVSDLCIGAGHYYVDGILCENEYPRACGAEEVEVTYCTQPYYPVDPNLDSFPDPPFLVYLDVWERHITHIQDPDIREVALGGPDTATRAQVVWQVKVAGMEEAGYGKKGHQQGPTDELNCSKIPWDELVERWQPRNRGCMKARTEEPQKTTDPCITPPDARYRGAENQLYRVEIHCSGKAWDGDTANTAGVATFKLSRNNGAVVFPAEWVSGATVKVEHLGRDSRSSLERGNWVGFVDDRTVLRGEPGPIFKVKDVDSVELTVELEVPQGTNPPDIKPEYHPLLRQWDQLSKMPDSHPADSPTWVDDNTPCDSPQCENSLYVEEDKWLAVGDGLQIYFASSGDPDKPHRYRTGDYSLIPVRTATGDVIWPQEPDNQGNLVPAASPPHGVEHHFAPLALVTIGKDGAIKEPINDCRCTFPQLCVPRTPLQVRRVLLYDHDRIQLVKELEDASKPLEIEASDENVDGIPHNGVSYIVVEFNRAIKQESVRAAGINDNLANPKPFSFRVTDKPGHLVPGTLYFDFQDMDLPGGPVAVFEYRTSAAGHKKLRPGDYTVTILGDPDPSGAQPILATDNTALDGEPPGLPSGDGSPGGDFTFEFTIAS